MTEISIIISLLRARDRGETCQGRGLTIWQARLVGTDVRWGMLHWKLVTDRHKSVSDRQLGDLLNVSKSFVAIFDFNVGK